MSKNNQTFCAPLFVIAVIDAGGFEFHQFIDRRRPARARGGARRGSASTRRCVIKISPGSFHTFLSGGSFSGRRRRSPQLKITAASQTPNLRGLINKSNQADRLANQESLAGALSPAPSKPELFTASIKTAWPWPGANGWPVS